MYRISVDIEAKCLVTKKQNKIIHDHREVEQNIKLFWSF